MGFKRHFIKYCPWTAGLLLFIFLLTPAFTGEGEAAGGKVVVVSVDRLSLDVLLDGASRLENLNTLLDEGGLGLMNVVTGGGLSSENAYATLGAGTRALGGANAQLGFHQEEKYYQDRAAVAFQRHYGIPPREDVVHLGLAETVRANQARPYRVVPGALGEALKEAGKSRAILGNADTGSPRRQSALFLMDAQGNVGSGQVSAELLLDDSLFPFGHRLDTQVLAPLFREYHNEADLLLVDWGDFYRLQEYREYLTPERQKELLEESLAELDLFVGVVLEELLPGTLLIFLSPTPPREDWGTGRMLAPVIVRGGRAECGLLTSATTRRQGIISNLDIPATILDHLQVEKPYYMLGRPIVSVPYFDGGEFLSRRLIEIARVYQQRPPVIQMYISLQVITVLVVLLGILGRFRRALLFRPVMLSLLLVPLVLLFLPLLPPWPLPATLLTIYGSAFLLGALLYKFLDYRISLLVIGLATSLALGLDLLAGSPFMQRSFLGYDPVLGARYYGIGNEYMGALVGSTLLFSALILQFFPSARKRVWFPLALYFLGVVILLAMPVLGANFGGTLTILAAGILMVVTLFWRQGRYMYILLGLLSGVAVMGILLWLNFPTPGREISHWGSSMAAISQGGVREITDILVRKASMGVRLLRYSYWSRVFISFLLAQAILLFRPLGIIREMRSQYPFFMSGIMGITFGAVVALLTNDSGVVAAAMALLFGTLPLLYLVMEKVFEAEAH